MELIAKVNVIDVQLLILEQVGHSLPQSGSSFRLIALPPNNRLSHADNLLHHLHQQEALLLRIELHYAFKELLKDERIAE